MDWITSHVGEINALATAAIWGVAVILFRKSGETVHPLGLNLFKNVLAMLLLIPTMWLFGESLFLPAPWQDYAMLFISGALGIAISDTLFFKSLNALGAGLSAIVDCLYSPFIIGLSMLWLGERLRPLQMLGALMIISAVLAATTESRGDKADRKRILLGILWGALAMATMAVAIVMVKPLLEDTPLLWATEWRIIGGIVFLLLILLFNPDRKKIVNSLRVRRGIAFTVGGSFAGGYLSMVLWVAGMKFTQASTAAALNQTSSIFVFIFAALLLKERITTARLIGIILGVAGTFLVAMN